MSRKITLYKKQTRSIGLAEFGAYLSTAITVSDETRASVAKMCGVNPSYITLLCNGAREPSTSMLVALSEALATFDLHRAIDCLARHPGGSHG